MPDSSDPARKEAAAADGRARERASDRPARHEAAGTDLPGPRRPPGPTRREAVRGLRRELREAGVESPEVEAERLVAAACGTERTELALAGGERLAAAEAGRLAGLVARRLAGEPLQHIEGTAAFRGLLLKADARALVPRPETEQLVDRIAEWARERPPRADADPPSRADAEPPPLADALDVGTGSGAIALALLTEGIVERVVGVDVSAAALEQAEENRAAAGVTPERLELRLASRPFWTAIEEAERFDLVVSNPPYVSDAELGRLPREVREREPRVALAGGPDGLDVVREIAGRAADHLRPGGALFLELGAGQGPRVRELLERAGRWAEVVVYRDLARHERFVRARLGGAP